MPRIWSLPWMRWGATSPRACAPLTPAIADHSICLCRKPGTFWSSCTGRSQARASGAVRWEWPGSQQPPPGPGLGRVRPASLPWGPEAVSSSASAPASRAPGTSQQFLTYSVGLNLFMFVFPFPVVSVSTGDRWVRVDGFFNLLPIKRLYFDYFIALCGV